MDYPLTKIDRCHTRLDSPTVTNLAVAGQYHPVAGTFTGSFLRNWTVAADGTMTFIGSDGKIFSFTGVSDLAVDKACRVTYVFYVNGVAVTSSETPHDFASSSKTENISTASILQLNKGDYMSIYAKSDSNNTTLTVNGLLLTFWGE